MRTRLFLVFSLSRCSFATVSARMECNILRAQLWSRIGLAGSLIMLFGTVSPAVYLKLVVSRVRV